jgi:hypothetical protein
MTILILAAVIWKQTKETKAEKNLVVWQMILMVMRSFKPKKCFTPRKHTTNAPKHLKFVKKKTSKIQRKEEKCLVPHAPAHECLTKKCWTLQNKQMTSNFWHSKSWIWLLPLMNSWKKSFNLAKSTKCYLAFDIPNCEFGCSHPWILKKYSWTLQKQRNDIYFFDIPYRESGRGFSLNIQKN